LTAAAGSALDALETGTGVNQETQEVLSGIGEVVKQEDGTACFRLANFWNLGIDLMSEVMISDGNVWSHANIGMA